VEIIVDVSPSSGGEVAVNGDVATSYPETFSLEQDSHDLLIEAIPAPGYCFVGWSGEDTLQGDGNPLELPKARNLDLVAVFAPGGEIVEYASPDGVLRVAIPYGISALDAEGMPVTNIGFTIVDHPPPTGSSEIVGYAYQIEPEGATFTPSVSMTWGYDASSIPDGVAPEQLTIAYYDESHDMWMALKSQLDLRMNTISAWIDHLSLFAVLAPTKVTPPEHAPCLGQLNVRPGESTSDEPVKSITISPDEPVYVDVRVRNIWDTTDSYIVTLEIDGVIEKQQEVTLAAGAFTTVTFETSRSEEGTYCVTVSGLYDEATLIVTGGSPSTETETRLFPDEPSNMTPTTSRPSPKALVLISIGVFCTVFALTRIRSSRDWY
jgi:hypothetical protein